MRACVQGVQVLLLATLPELLRAVRHSRVADIVDSLDLGQARPERRCHHQIVEPPTSEDFTPLTFIHIPRTGGTSAEDCAKDEPRRELRWGKFNPNIMALDGRAKELGNPTCSPWHLPPNFVEGSYTQGETFCMVRHPFTRMISQYGFACSYFPDNKTKDCTVNGLNLWMEKMLHGVEHRPFYGDCHFLPQAAMVYGFDRAAGRPYGPGGRQYCQHVLPFERLYTSFNELMERSGYPYRLETSRKHGADENTRSKTQCHLLTPMDFSEENRERLLRFFAVDFEVFNYTAEPSSWEVDASQA